MNSALFVVVLITGLALVGAALLIAGLISPRSFNPQKGEPYECGIPSRGESWMQFKVGYYLFAILYLMFDVETVFLFPWAVILKDLGVAGLFNILFFMVEVKIKSMKYEDFKDNEYIEQLISELKASNTNVVVGCLDEVINWGRSNSLWPLTFATSCCGIEFMSLGAARYDMARFGFEVARASPRQADFVMVAGTIVHRMAPVLKRLYDQLAEPK